MKIKAIIVLATLFFSGCSTYEATYQKTPLIIDGSSSDWISALDSKDQNGFSYGVSNDNENLYLRINVNDQSIQRKMMLAGLTVWVDTTGKKKENLGINCPMQKAFLSAKDKGSKGNIPNAPIWDDDQILDVEFIGFNNSNTIYYISNNPYGIEVSIAQGDFKSLNLK
ncbi:MAG: hypothetical protein GQ564_19885 [Bacteroidales bacterium]|nr:hypothetical protein [Bacteroidales bacterium]